jgi:hypothetical protein
MVFVLGDMPWIDVHLPYADKEKKIVFMCKVFTSSVKALGSAGISFEVS